MHNVITLYDNKLIVYYKSINPNHFYIHFLAPVQIIMILNWRLVFT